MLNCTHRETFRNFATAQMEDQTSQSKE